MWIKVFKLNANAQLPSYATEGSAGADLHACLGGESVTIQPGERALIPTGLAFELPFGIEGQIRPRSGLAHKHGITVANSPGTVDSDYRGEISVCLVNLGALNFAIHDGDRVAQIVACPITRATFVQFDELSATKRGAGGFGSTGK